MPSSTFLSIDSALTEFVINGLPVRNLTECLQTGLKSVNADVRTNATKALVTTNLCIGVGLYAPLNLVDLLLIDEAVLNPDIGNFLPDLKPQLLATIKFLEASSKLVEALTTIHDILEQSKRSNLKLGNKAVQTLALDAVSRLAVGMGKPLSIGLLNEQLILRP
ncbi:hypothetical protein VP01_4327g2 [Puccinia sorghi]|uniref:Uncharacterized protein n=1 Tax=Puccinia sorghi TaxID=27349 RepID=A0A0L6US03_9BASI|nr:hypothetical protein VP01_4327g2 [Puccinia sorghi]